MFLGLQSIAIFTMRSRLQHKPRRPRIREFLSPLTEVTFLLNALGCFFVFWGILIPFNYITLAAESSGMSRSLAQYLIPIINGASFFGRTLPPWAGDHLGLFNTAIVFTIFGSVLSMALWIPVSSNPNAQNLVFASLYGFPLGVFAAILPALVGQISDVRQIGVRLGATFFITSWAGLTGNPIAGALLKPGPNFTDLKIFCGVTVAVGALFLVAARISQGGGAKLMKKA
ncbi:hypothetical protein MMC29_002583 [Sticta canariensis]|nr:hypothetical protein [Sticta canariensis]